MTYLITGACIGVKDEACVATCPVDCIIGVPDDPMLFIDPALCIDCAACVPVCPVNAIVHENDVPAQFTPYIAINRQYFSDRQAALATVQAQQASIEGPA
jgi:ferredoxin